MKTKLFFLLILPLVWLAVALISYQTCADKLYILAIAPSAWLAFFGDWLLHPIPQLQVAGLPAMLVVGLILLALKMTPRVAIISSLILTLSGRQQRSSNRTTEKRGATSTSCCCADKVHRHSVTVLPADWLCWKEACDSG